MNLSASGPPTTMLDPEPPEAVAALALALEQPPEQRREAVAEVVARHPTFLDGWARLGELARDRVEAYADFRVGYHRGLDRLRANGWRGTGYVPWASETNRGFLRSLRGLATAAAAIGEEPEAERCGHFLAQCDPGGVPAEG